MKKFPRGITLFIQLCIGFVIGASLATYRDVLAIFFLLVGIAAVIIAEVYERNRGE